MPARPEPALFLYAGPTLASSPRATAFVQKMARSRTSPIRLRRPIRRKDLPKLVEAEKKPGIIAIVDGVFHDFLAVGHAEIRDAMHAGWQVWGLSSMGAIRAREMEPLGMRGFGDVFRRFVDEDDFQDDEVTLLHSTEAPYDSVTEPLVHLRVAADHLVAAKIVTRTDADAVIAELKSLWYGDRTLRGTIEAFRRRHPESAEPVKRELRDFQRFRIKTHDLERFLDERAWIGARREAKDA